MKRVISFSLWGSNPKYTIGALKNLDIAKNIFPDWECWFYVSNDVPKKIINKINSYSNAKTLNMEGAGWEGLFWRFFPISEKSVEVCIFRDTDSRLSEREKSAVDDWINKNKKLHIMRDHERHQSLIMGGMWGFRGTLEIETLIEDYRKKAGKDCYNLDQRFLAKKIYHKFKNDSVIHDESGYCLWNERHIRENFPTKRKNMEFIGCVYDKNDHPSVSWWGGPHAPKEKH